MSNSSVISPCESPQKKLTCWPIILRRRSSGFKYTPSEAYISPQTTKQCVSLPFWSYPVGFGLVENVRFRWIIVFIICFLFIVLFVYTALVERCEEFSNDGANTPKITCDGIVISRTEKQFRCPIRSTEALMQVDICET
jgi:hypothetical protein